MVPTALADPPHVFQPYWFHTEVMGRGPGAVTFALLKPNAHTEHTGEILEMISDTGLTVLSGVERKLGVRDVRALYWPHVGKSFYDRNAEFMLSAPCLLLALAGTDAVARWRQVLMPRIRQRWDLGPDAPKHLNFVHGSDSDENAFRELLYFFG